MIQRNLCKLVQRQTYSCLSHKYGIYFAYSCLVIIVYSTFHFSEELLELTKSHYEAKFSIYSDNVASMSFRKQLSADLPIDVVYTWVNGSDPIFQQQLKQLKLNSEDFEEEIDRDLCIFDNCLILPLLMIDDHIVGDKLLFTSSYPPFTVTMKPNINSTLHRFASMDKMRKEKMKAEKGNNFTLGYFHVTSDQSAPDSNLLKMAVMLKPIPKEIKNKDELEGILPNSLKEKLDWLHFDSSKQISVVWLTDDSIVGGLLDSKMESELKNGFKFGTDRIDVLPVYHVLIKQNKNLDDISRSRFEDNEELRYSIRSVMKYAPWIRRIFIVTNGQIPSWLDLRVPRVTLVTHEEIFPNKSHLPTFSSPAIETHLHRIQGLADHYIYMNDDVMFGKEVWPEDFYTHTGGYKVYLTWPVPNCAEGCPANWIKDGYCDSPCNKTECDFDGGDCVGDNVRGGVGMNQSPNLLGIGDSWRTTSNNCQPACSNYWLADKFCDQACNHVECAFDCGDCGTAKYDEIYKIMTSSDEINGSTYNIPDGHHSAYISLSNILDDVSDAGYKILQGDGSVRASAVSNMYKLLTILLFPQSNFTKVTMKLTGVAPTNSNKTQTIMFNITANPSAPKQNITTTITPTTTISTTTVGRQVDEVTPPELTLRRDEVARWADLNATILVGNSTDDEIGSDLKRLKKELDDGLLTQLGYNRQLGKLLMHRTHSDVTNEQGGDVTYEERGGAVEMKLERVGLGDDKNIGDGLKENNLLHQRRLVEYKNEEGIVHRSRTLLDAFGDSLRYVSRIYNRKYGFTKRRVPAHMPHFIDKDIMTELHDKFANEFDLTSSHKLRHAQDMQFAFSYFYYLMSEEKELNFDDYFHQLDTDGSGILSDRELRTLVTRINDSPLTMDKLTEMERELRNCADSLMDADPAVQLETNETKTNISQKHLSIISDHPTEVYFDKMMPQVTNFLFISCPYITEKLEKAVGKQNKYKFQEMSQDELAFKMLKENVSTVVGQLDDIRRNPKKFICLNDNVDHTIEHAATVKIVVRELLQALFPIPSPFELPQEYRNKFEYISQLEEYKIQEDRYRKLLQAIAIFIVFILLSMSFTNELYSLLRPFKRYLLRFYRLVCVGRVRRFSPASLKDNV